MDERRVQGPGGPAKKYFPLQSGIHLQPTEAPDALCQSSTSSRGIEGRPVIRVVCSRCGSILSEGALGAQEQLVVCAPCHRDMRPGELVFREGPRDPDVEAKLRFFDDTCQAYLRGLGLEALPVLLLVPAILIWAELGRAVLA